MLFRGQSSILHSPGILCELSTRLRAAELQINWVVLLVGVDNSPHSRLNQQENMLEPQDGKTLRNLTLQVLDGGQKSVLYIYKYFYVYICIHISLSIPSSLSRFHIYNFFSNNEKSSSHYSQYIYSFIHS